MADKEKLSVGVKIGYGFGDMGGNLFFTVISFWLMKFLTDQIGLPGTLAGAALMIGKFVDAITDPMMGAISDRTRSRWGRRRPYFLFGALPLAVSFFFMFTNPHIQDTNWLFIWAAGMYVLICVACTVVNIPYNALTPDLTKDFEEKTALNGYRMEFAAIGTLIGAVSAPILINAFGPAKEAQTQGYMLMGGIFGLVMLIAALVPFFAVREKYTTPPESGINLFKEYARILKNVPYLLILLPWVFNVVAVTIVTASFAYYFEYVLNNKDMIPLATGLLIISAMVFIPLTVKISEVIGKKMTYFVGMFIFAGAILAVFFFGVQLGIVFVFIMMGVAGMGFSTHYVMPWAIIPDTIEYDYQKTGIRSEGSYYGLWTFFIKLGRL